MLIYHPVLPLLCIRSYTDFYTSTLPYVSHGAEFVTWNLSHVHPPFLNIVSPEVSARALIHFFGSKVQGRGAY